MKIRLEPLGVTVEAADGMPLQDALAPYGVEFPCGGAGTCEGCRVHIPGQGWRLACQMRATEPLTLHVDQWETPILSDSVELDGGVRDGFGVAVDLGTTTVVAQLVDLRSGVVHGVRTALNPQAVRGADLMSRIEFAMRDGGLTPMIRDCIDGMIADLGHDPVETVIVGNTAMHHLYLGLNVDSLAAVPFRTPYPEERREGRTRFLRCLGGFVGSDVLAGIAATALHRAEGLSALIDLGTNGEIVVGRGGRLVCASTAAGPAFEGGRISQGMRAATGAIAHVEADGTCHVVGGGTARGICGSGLVDAVAHALDSGAIKPNGRIAAPLRVNENVALTQKDIRELQLAKGAIAAGLKMLLARFDATVDDLENLYLAGAFGNYLDVRSAIRIGLLPPIPPERIVPSGNTALRGARLILLHPSAEPGIEVDHVELASDPAFQDEFADALAFPAMTSCTKGEQR